MIDMNIFPTTYAYINYIHKCMYLVSPGFSRIPHHDNDNTMLPLMIKWNKCALLTATNYRHMA